MIPGELPFDIPNHFPAPELLELGHPWFQVFQMPGDFWAIFEPGHYEQVFSFLIAGRDRALFLDTGMGVADIRELAWRLTPLPILVVNSHTHYDHVGGNHLFEASHALDCDTARERLAQGWPNSAIASKFTPDLFFQGPPPGFDPATFSIPPTAFRPIAEGHRFDLGGRELLALETPGHSPDSIMLLDEENRLLFTGDTYYPDLLYAHLADSDLAAYKASMDRLCAMTERFNWLICSHIVPVRPASDLIEAARAFGEILDGRDPDDSPEPGFVDFTESFFHIRVREDQLPPRRGA